MSSTPPCTTVAIYEEKGVFEDKGGDVGYQEVAEDVFNSLDVVKTSPYFDPQFQQSFMDKVKERSPKNRPPSPKNRRERRREAARAKKKELRLDERAVTTDEEAEEAVQTTPKTRAGRRRGPVMITRRVLKLDEGLAVDGREEAVGEKVSNDAEKEEHEDVMFSQSSMDRKFEAYLLGADMKEVLANNVVVLKDDDVLVDAEVEQIMAQEASHETKKEVKAVGKKEEPKQEKQADSTLDFLAEDRFMAEELARSQKFMAAMDGAEDACDWVNRHVMGLYDHQMAANDVVRRAEAARLRAEALAKQEAPKKEVHFTQAVVVKHDAKVKMENAFLMPDQEKLCEMFVGLNISVEELLKADKGQINTYEQWKEDFCTENVARGFYGGCTAKNHTLLGFREQVEFNFNLYVSRLEKGQIDPYRQFWDRETIQRARDEMFDLVHDCQNALRWAIQHHDQYNELMAECKEQGVSIATRAAASRSFFRALESKLEMVADQYWGVLKPNVSKVQDATGVYATPRVPAYTDRCSPLTRVREALGTKYAPREDYLEPLPDYTIQKRREEKKEKERVKRLDKHSLSPQFLF